MDEIKFKGEVWMTGNSSVVTVPKVYMDNGLLKPNQKYEFTVRKLP